MGEAAGLSKTDRLSLGLAALMIGPPVPGSISCEALMSNSTSVVSLVVGEDAGLFSLSAEADVAGDALHSDNQS